MVNKTVASLNLPLIAAAASEFAYSVRVASYAFSVCLRHAVSVRRERLHSDF
ncbi:MAG: hypothetical protein RM368_00855 [Nostoc sp. DedSLP03]|uniref:hypothetical protein n=1 Tax=Nostoc sp. DedSLP03 TaxID=3075400 RepID=UPI002AD43EF8|nr:hypothetical protein [Nostoc sp. DedSLP03]MDZ7963521.1 hypothetical protein [Nostoc sp. DedSLP03]